MGIGVVCSTPLSQFNSTRVMMRCSKFTNPPGQATSTPRVFKVVLFLFLFCRSFQCNILRDFLFISVSFAFSRNSPTNTHAHTRNNTLPQQPHCEFYLYSLSLLKMYYPFATPQPQDTDDSGDDNNSWSPAAVGPSSAAASV